VAFNRAGYKHDGMTVTPAWTITWIDENSDWIRNDHALSLGSGWRIPLKNDNADTVSLDKLKRT
jgi:hypothetical protein